jgi:hypothetical protein
MKSLVENCKLAGCSGPFPNLGRWGRRVSARHVGQEGAIYQLKFQRAHPEFDLNLAADALVTANFAVPGQGVFRASNSIIRLRPPSRYRDNIQLHTGNRFLPQEHTRREQPLEQRPLWFSHTRGLPGIGR